MSSVVAAIEDMQVINIDGTIWQSRPGRLECL